MRTAGRGLRVAATSVLLFAVSAAPALAAGKDPVQAFKHGENVVMKIAAMIFISVLVGGAIPLMTGRRHGDLGRHMGVGVLVGLVVLAPLTFIALLTGFYSKL